MNFLDIKAGENIEIGTQKAYRFWRYAFAPTRLASWVSDMHWPPDQFVEGTSPDTGDQGIHGFRTMEDLLWSCNDEPQRLVARSQMCGYDGIVIGTVELWGIIWDHKRGHRAQFARPTSFISIYGNWKEKALAELRVIFKHADGDI